MRSRTFILGTVGLLALAVGVAFWTWHQRTEGGAVSLGVETVDDPASRDAKGIDWATGSPLTFTWGDGSGLYGYNTVKVKADGRTEYVFRDESDRTKWLWRQATFTLDANSLAGLRGILADVDYFSLKQLYHNTGVADGTQRFVKVEIAGKRKGVYCNNYFPHQIGRIHDFVTNHILVPNAIAIAAAVPYEMTAASTESEFFPDPSKETRP